jgi:hypothetical protein
MQNASWLSRLALMACCLVHLALLPACAKAKAAAVPDGPPLAVPAPPPRIFEPVEEIAVVPPPPPPVEPAATPPRTPPRTQPRQEPRPEPPAPVAAQPTPPPATPPPSEPREVRAVPSAAAAAEEKKVRDVMAQATRDLNRVDYRRLSPEGRSQYDQSKRFGEQADEAVKQKNFVYAMTLADKAATLAAELAGSR